jgi:4-amino-4-deoxy-L-arabinose transferase-like glycosyltransferase
MTGAEIAARQSEAGLAMSGSGDARPMQILPMVVVAALLRVTVAAVMFERDPEDWFYNQASEFTCLARSILSGQGLSSPFGGATGPSAFLAPGYPLLVATVFRIFGASSVASAEVLVAIHGLFGLGTVVAVMLLARRLFGRRTAMIAGALCAMSPTMVFLPTVFWETSFSTLMLTGFAVLALGCVDAPRLLNWLAMGVLSAAAMLVNPSLLLAFAGMGLWAAWRAGGSSGLPSDKRWVGPGLAVASCVVLFAIWPIRNAYRMHAFVPLRSNLGYELWQGNRPGSDGLFVHELYLDQNNEEFARYESMGELAYMAEKTRIAKAAIKADPGRFSRATVKRAAIFWTGIGGGPVSWIVTGEIAGASLFGFIGVAAVLRRRGDALVLAIPFLVFPLPYYVTHPDLRFRLLLEPIALVLAAWVVAQGYGRVEAQG